jgi:hypothetical protein
VTKYEYRESYKHLYAKKVLADWMRSEEAAQTDYCKVAQFQWRKNYGVFDELPFREGDNIYYFECERGTGEILFVPDIVVFEKGTPYMIFEIVHKNPVSDKKLEKIIRFFGGFGWCLPNLYEVNADYLLNQISIPEVIKCRQILFA